MFICIHLHHEVITQKRTMKHILFLIIIAVAWVACATESKSQKKDENKPVIVKQIPVVDPFENNAWLAELEKDRGELKAAWLRGFNPYSFADQKHMENFHVINQGDNTAIMWIIPVVNYLIRYKPYIEWNGKDSIESLMELSETTAYGFIVKGDTIIGAVDYLHTDTTWKSTSWGPFDKKSAAFLSNLCFKKKERIINIYIEGSDEPKTYLRQYLVYKENGEYRHFLSGGGSSRLIDDLIEGQRNNKAGVEW